MKIPIDYKNFKINKIADIDELYEVIETQGGFTLSDYKALVKKVKNTSQPVRIKRRLEKYIKPLACDYIEPEKEKGHYDIIGIEKTIQSNIKIPKRHVNNSDPFDKSYKASDFRLKDGYIELGELRLTSKRVQQASRKLLLNIDHTFKIGKDNRGENEFHFIPYTDLSFLLESVENNRCKYNIIESSTGDAEQICKDDIVKRYNKYKENLKSEIEYFFNNASAYEEHLDYINGYIRRFNVKALYEKLMQFNILSNELSYSQFYKCIDNCDVRIPMKDVEIHDGEIEVSLKHMLFTTGICWDDFKSWCRCDENCEFLVIHEDELKPIFNESLVKFLSVIDSRPSIHVKTYISKKNFKYVFLSKGRLKDRLYEHEPSLYGHDYLVIPHQYLLNDFNEGFSILLNIHKDYYDEVLTSDAYKFPKSIQDEILSKIKLYKRKYREEYKYLIPSLKNFKSHGISHDIAWTLYSDQENEIYLKSLLFRILSSDYVPKVRKVTNYYLGRECGGYYKGEARIYRFIEDLSHYSDYNGFHENGVSHAIVKYKDNTIILKPSVKKYSIYVFTIDTTNNCIDAAAAVLIKYFSSALLYNKRQSFSLNNLFKVFGIRSFRKVTNNI